jgi:hypothetical protein
MFWEPTHSSITMQFYNPSQQFLFKLGHRMFDGESIIFVRKIPGIKLGATNVTFQGGDCNKVCISEELFEID